MFIAIIARWTSTTTICRSLQISRIGRWAGDCIGMSQLTLDAWEVRRPSEGPSHENEAPPQLFALSLQIPDLRTAVRQHTFHLFLPYTDPLLTAIVRNCQQRRHVSARRKPRLTPWTLEDRPGHTSHTGVPEGGMTGSGVNVTSADCEIS